MYECKGIIKNHLKIRNTKWKAEFSLDFKSLFRYNFLKKY